MRPTRRAVTGGVVAGLAGLVGLGTTSAQEASTTIEHAGDGLTLDAAPEQAVRGRTEFAAGVDLTVRLRSSGASPFLRTTEATVAEDGTFEATFDLSAVEPGTSFTATVLWQSFEQASADGTVAAVDPRVSLDYEGETFALAAGVEQSVTGESDLSEGSTLSVRLQSNRGSLFLATDEATVGADGAFEATLDLSGVDSTTFALLEVYYDGERRQFAIAEVAA